MNSSKGNQAKYWHEGYWYKADYLGYEAAAEFFTSSLLENSNVKNFVKYELSEVEVGTTKLRGCKSKDFLNTGDTLVTLERSFKAIKGVEIKQYLVGKSIKDKILSVVDFAEQNLKYEGFGEYLCLLMELDAFTLNEDRHFHNIAFVRNKTGKYCPAPIFDNGAGWLSDTRIDYPLDTNTEQLLPKVKAQPFAADFDEQIDVIEELYGKQLQFNSEMSLDKCFDEIRLHYGAAISERMNYLYRAQSRKYQYLYIGY